MRPETGLENGVEALRARIDELTTNWMIAGPGETPGEQLEAFAEEAGRSGFEETARLAAGLAESLTANAADAGALDETLRHGLNRLRLSLEQAEQTAEPGKARELQASVSSSFAEDTDLIRDFVMESREHLDSIESRMLELEKNPSDAETLNSVFRTFHTIKGLAGFLEFGGIQSVAHQLETLLDLARNGKKAVDSAVVDVALESADYIKADLNRIEVRLGGEDEGQQADNGALLKKIAKLIAGGDDAAPAPAIQTVAVPAPA
ncbi:MAG: Hpt domain-containing protein, partial [Acidobacteriaceae bacterium]